jgi:hypothetical protein
LRSTPSKVEEIAQHAVFEVHSESQVLRKHKIPPSCCSAPFTLVFGCAPLFRWGIVEPFEGRSSAGSRRGGKPPLCRSPTSCIYRIIAPVKDTVAASRRERDDAIRHESITSPLPQASVTVPLTQSLELFDGEVAARGRFTGLTPGQLHRHLARVLRQRFRLAERCAFRFSVWLRWRSYSAYRFRFVERLSLISAYLQSLQ